MAALSARHNRAADATSVLSTACRSKVDRLMTLSTSAVAVCCSSASASFFFRSALARSTWVLAFVPVERSLRPRVGLFAPLRDKVTSSAQSLVPLPVGPAKDGAYQSLTANRDESRAVSSFDSLVGTGEQGGRYLDAKRLGGLHVDHQFVLRWCLYRQVGWLLAFEDASDVRRGTPVEIDLVGPIGQQAAVDGLATGRGEGREAGGVPPV